MNATKTSTTKIMTVNEMIAVAFGDEDSNRVNFKLVQAILLVLANQLRILQRQIAIDFDSPVRTSSSSLVISELKIGAYGRKKKKKVPKGKTVKSSAYEIQPNNPADTLASKHEPRHKLRSPPTNAKKSEHSKHVKTSPSTDKKITQKEHVDEVFEKTEVATQRAAAEHSSLATVVFNRLPAYESVGKPSSPAGTSDVFLSPRDESRHAAKMKQEKDSTKSEESSTSKHFHKVKSMEGKSSTQESFLRRLPSVESEIRIEKMKYLDLMEKMEEQREQLLRVIHQSELNALLSHRKNSRDEGMTPPSPIASMDPSEMQYEKLILVERLSNEDMKTRQLSEHSRPLSIITLEQFNALTNLVIELQKRFDASNYGSPNFPENAELMQAIRKGSTSLTDAMAALQLSARLEATERVLEKLMSLVTDLAKNIPGFKETANTLEYKAIQIPSEIKSKLISKTAVTETQLSSLDKHPMVGKQGEVNKKTMTKPKPPNEPYEILRRVSKSLTSLAMSTTSFNQENSDKNFQEITTKMPVTKEQLQTALSNEQADIFQTLMKLINRSNSIAIEAMKKSEMIEKKIDAATHVSKRMLDVENMVKDYTEQVNTIDSLLTSQMANHQDQLTQMQFDLESSIENMTEAIARQGIDPELVLQLNSNFTSLQTEIDKANLVQKDANFIQRNFSAELKALRREIELLRDAKCDRDEVVDALRDKAGIKDLNGMVREELLMATVGDLEKQINQAHHTFYSHEQMWQKALDDIFAQIDDKSDRIHLDGLRVDINKYLNKFKVQLDNMQKIVGEPMSAGVTRRIFRDTACISCCNVAHPVPPDVLVPLLPSVRSPGVGAEKPKSKGEGDQPVCNVGMKIPHPMDTKTEMCTRYCGGRRYPICGSEVDRMADAIRAQQMPATENDETMGLDGKLYKVEMTPKPCIPCNVQHHSQKAQEAEHSGKGASSAAGARTNRYDGNGTMDLEEINYISDSDLSGRFQPFGSLFSFKNN